MDYILLANKAFALLFDMEIDGFRDMFAEDPVICLGDRREFGFGTPDAIALRFHDFRRTYDWYKIKSAECQVRELERFMQAIGLFVLTMSRGGASEEYGAQWNIVFDELKICSFDIALSLRRAPAYEVRLGSDKNVLEEDKVIYIEAGGKHVKWHYADGACVERRTLKSRLEILSSNFIQIHKAYVVNVDHVISVTYKEAKLSDGTVLPIRRGMRDEIQALIDQRKYIA